MQKIRNKTHFLNVQLLFWEITLKVAKTENKMCMNVCHTHKGKQNALNKVLLKINNGF